jgi:hypothetical protein
LVPAKLAKDTTFCLKTGHLWIGGLPADCFSTVIAFPQRESIYIGGIWDNYSGFLVAVRRSRNG